MEVSSFKLLTGEELVAGVVRGTGTGYIISKPLAVHVMRNQEGQPTLAFAQWSMVQDTAENVELFDHALAAKPVKVLAAVSDSYLQQTSSLILPKTTNQILKG